MRSFLPLRIVVGDSRSNLDSSERKTAGDREEITFPSADLILNGRISCPEGNGRAFKILESMEKKEHLRWHAFTIVCRGY